MSNARSYGRCLAAAVMLGVTVLAAPVSGEEPAPPRKQVLGMDTVIALYGDFKDVPSQNFNATGITWFTLLKNPLEVGSQNIINAAVERNPDEPAICIDEFGFDYDGQIDLKTAKVLRLAKEQKPELGLAVWQMRGPVAPKLAAAYREVVDLILMESYVGPKDLWLIAAQLQAARLNGLGDRSIVGLGAGRCGRDHVDWATTRQDLEEQIRFIRLVAPESPGVGFFAMDGNMKDQPITYQDIDDICSQFDELPTDGSGLRPELIELASRFTKQYSKPALVCSPSWVQPNFNPGHVGPDGKWVDWGKLAEPLTFRALILNLGDTNATNVIVRLRNPDAHGGNVFAKGIVDVPARSVAVAVLPVFAEFKAWTGEWEMEVDAADAEVLMHNLSHYE